MQRMSASEIHFTKDSNDIHAEGGGRVKRRLSKTVDAMGRSSDISTRMGAGQESRIRAAAGGCSTKNSLAMTLAVMWDEEEGTQEVPSEGEYRGKRFTRTTTREIAQIHAATHWMRVRRRGGGIISDGIGTPPSKYSSTILFYTRCAERESRPVRSQILRAQDRLARVPKLLTDCISTLTACRRRRCIRWRSAYRRGDRPG
jgi:hypothetical protein